MKTELKVRVNASTHKVELQVLSGGKEQATISLTDAKADSLGIQLRESAKTLRTSTQGLFGRGWDKLLREFDSLFKRL